jgi:hypothetical protein
MRQPGMRRYEYPACRNRSRLAAQRDSPIAIRYFFFPFACDKSEPATLLTFAEVFGLLNSFDALLASPFEVATVLSFPLCGVKWNRTIKTLRKNIPTIVTGQAFFS